MQDKLLSVVDGTNIVVVVAVVDVIDVQLVYQVPVTSNSVLIECITINNSDIVTPCTIIIIIIIFFNIKLTNATMCTIIKQIEQSIYKMQSI